jgi:hypothetical protein
LATSFGKSSMASAVAFHAADALGSPPRSVVEFRSVQRLIISRAWVRRHPDCATDPNRAKENREDRCRVARRKQAEAGEDDNEPEQHEHR